ncbi:dihydrofolate reductase family protein [Parabacteroides sp.]
MKQIKAHIAVSLDGFIATSDHELNWLPQSVKVLLGKACDSANTLLMGSNTYTYIFEHWGGWPHIGKRSFVVSNHDTNVTPDCGVEFLTDNPLRVVRDMKVDIDIQVVGGGKLLTSLIKMGLMDNLTVYTVPVMLGRGVPFIGETFGSEWELLMNMVMDDGIVVTEYKFKKSL